MIWKMLKDVKNGYWKLTEIIIRKALRSDILIFDFQ